MKPTSKLHRGFVAATLGLTASLTLPVVFSDFVLRAQTVQPQSVSIFDQNHVSSSAPLQQTPQAAPVQVASLQPITPSAEISPLARQQAFQKLHLARKAVAARDIATAERLLNEVKAMQLTYQEKEDQPALVQNLIQQARQLSEQGKTQRNTEQFHRSYALFNLIQADTMLRRNELDLADQLTQEAAKQQVQYSQRDRDEGLEPSVMSRRIDDARRAQGLSTHVATTQSPQPLSQAAQEQLGQAVQKLHQARQALEAGQLEQAERLTRTAAAYELPEYAFPQGNTPNRFLAEIAAQRQGMLANPQPVGPQPIMTDAHVMQASAGNQPAMAPQIPAPGRNTPFIDQTIQNRNVVNSQFSSTIIQKLSDADRMCEVQRKPEAALDMLYELKRNVEQSTQIDSETKGAHVLAIDRAIEKTINFRNRYTTQERQDRNNEAVWAELRHEQETFLNKEAQLASMFKEYKKFVDEQRYEEALRIAKKAKEFAPDEPSVQVMVTMAQLVYNNNRSQDIAALKREGVIDSLTDVDRASIIPDFGQNSVLYANNWNDLTLKRQASNKNIGYQRSETEKRIIRQLSKPVTLNIPQPVPLDQALKILCEQVELSYFLDSAALQAAEIPTGTMVNIPVVNAIMMKSALNAMLEQHGLAYDVKNEMLYITSKKAAKGTLVPRSYYIADILYDRFSLPECNVMEDAHNRAFERQDPNRSRNGNMRSGANMQSPPPSGGSPVSRNTMPISTESNPNILAQYGSMGGGMSGGYGGGMMGGGMGGGMMGGGMGGGMMGGGMGGGMMGGGMGGGMMGGMGGGMGYMGITDIIQSIIEPESWENFGASGEGSLSFHSATQSLIIRQTEEVHAQIEDLLTQIRKMNDLQIAVEVRYITLTDAFYESMGIDFAMNFNNDSAFSRLTQVQNVINDGNSGTSTGTTTSKTRGNNIVVGLNAPKVFSASAEVPVSNDSIGIAIPSYGGYNPAAGISTGVGLLMNNIETYFFIKAAQGDRRNSVMEAPKVMLQSGQPGMINDITQVPFVTSVTPVVADFAIGYQPIVTMLNQGQVLRVVATVSNDRQHVRLVLNPTFSTLIRTQTFKYFGDDTTTEETETTRGDDTASTSTSTDPRSSAKKTSVARSGVTIQQPIMATFSVMTTVNCPDGGTALLGGIKRLSEGRVEAGVPMLNKIPYLQRLFTNQAIGRDTQSVMIMVTPRIIIQDEEEQNLMGMTGRSVP